METNKTDDTVTSFDSWGAKFRGSDMFVYIFASIILFLLVSSALFFRLLYSGYQAEEFLESKYKEEFTVMANQRYHFFDYSSELTAYPKKRPDLKFSVVAQSGGYLSSMFGPYKIKDYYVSEYLSSSIKQNVFRGLSSGLKVDVNVWPAFDHPDNIKPLAEAYSGEIDQIAEHLYSEKSQKIHTLVMVAHQPSHLNDMALIFSDLNKIVTNIERTGYRNFSFIYLNERDTKPCFQFDFGPSGASTVYGFNKNQKIPGVFSEDNLEKCFNQTPA